MTLPITFTVDDTELIAVFESVASGMAAFLDAVAEDLASAAAGEAASVSQRLAAPWSVGDGGSPSERGITAPEWWARFLANGTQAHGPASAPFLVFEVDGETVFAREVEGIAANDFEERAAAKTGSHLDALLQRAIEGV